MRDDDRKCNARGLLEIPKDVKRQSVGSMVLESNKTTRFQKAAEVVGMWNMMWG
jgi:hypothetical protein